MNPSRIAFAGAVLLPTVPSARSSFVTSHKVRRNALSFTKAKVSEYRFPRCDLGSEENGHIVDVEGSVFDMDDENINLEEVEFPVGIPILNSVQLTGRLGANPELRTIREGLEVCKFSVAVQHEFDPSADPDDNTSWFDIEVWGSLGRSTASRIRKGLRVGIIGSIDVNAWTNKEGELVESPVVTATSVEVLQSRSEAMPSMSGGTNSRRFEETQPAEHGANSKYSGIQIDGDLKDLPF